MKPFDGHLSFDLPAGFTAVRGTNDNGEETFQIKYHLGRNEKGEETAELTFGVAAQNIETIPEEKRNLESQFHAALMSHTEQTQVLFFTIMPLIVAVVVEHKTHSYAISTVKAGPEESLQENAETVAACLTQVLNAMVIDGDRGHFAAVTAGQLLSGGGASEPGGEVYPSASPKAGQHTHLDFMNKTKSALSMLGGLVQVNQSGTEYAFCEIADMAGHAATSELEQILGRIGNADCGGYPYAVYAREMARLFRVNPDVFDSSHDREQEILGGFIRRAYMYNALRSFAWTLCAWCEEHNKTPAEADAETLQQIADFVKMRKYLNYTADSHCPVLCSGDDIHVAFLPDAVSESDRQALLKALNAGIPDDQPKSGIASLEGLRGELAWLYPAMDTVFDVLEADRDRDEELEGSLADVLYAWCAMTYAAKAPIYTEDGPMNNDYQHPEKAPEMEQWLYQNRLEQEKENVERWMKENKSCLTKSPAIVFSGRKFVFSGMDEQMPEILEALLKKGGLERKAVSGQTDYLVCDPRYAGGSKIRQARAEQAKGKKVQIVLAKDFMQALGLKMKETNPPEPPQKQEEPDTRPRGTRVSAPKSESQSEILTYTQDLKVETADYTMEIPDGFVIEEGKEGRDFIAWRPGTGVNSYVDSPIVIFAGQALGKEIVEQYSSVEEYVSVARIQHLGSAENMQRIFEGLHFFPIDRKDLPGGVSISYDPGILHANATLGVGDHLQMMRIQFSDVKKTKRRDYDAVIKQILEHLHAKQPVKLTPELDDEIFLSRTPDKKLISDWKNCISQRMKDLDSARMVYQNGLVSRFQTQIANGTASEVKIKKDLRTMLQYYVDCHEREIRIGVRAFTEFCKRYPDHPQLPSLWDCLKALVDTADKFVNLNGERIEVKSAYARTAMQNAETPELKAYFGAQAQKKQAEKAERERKEKQEEQAYAAWERKTRQIKSQREKRFEELCEAEIAEMQRIRAEEQAQKMTQLTQKEAALKAEKEEAERTLSALGVFKFSEKKALREKIATLSESISQTSKDIWDLSKQMQKAETPELSYSKKDQLRKKAASELPLPKEPPKPAARVQAEKRAVEEARKRKAEAAKQVEKARDSYMSKLYSGRQEDDMIRSYILSAMDPDTLYSTDDLSALSISFTPLTSAKVAFLMRDLVANGVVRKKIENRHTYYMLAD